MGKGQSKSHIVIFVEGDTDQIFFEGLLEYYRNHSSTPVHSCEVKNLKGVSRYTSKVIGKLKNEICPKARKKGMEVKAVVAATTPMSLNLQNAPSLIGRRWNVK